MAVTIPSIQLIIHHHTHPPFGSRLPTITTLSQAQKYPGTSPSRSPTYKGPVLLLGTPSHSPLLFQVSPFPSQPLSLDQFFFLLSFALSPSGPVEITPDLLKSGCPLSFPAGSTLIDLRLSNEGRFRPRISPGDLRTKQRGRRRRVLEVPPSIK